MDRQAQSVIVVTDDRFVPALVFFVNSLLIAAIRVIATLPNSIHSPLLPNGFTTILHIISIIAGLYSILIAAFVIILAVLPETRELSQELMALPAPTLILIPILCLRKPSQPPVPSSSYLWRISGHSFWPPIFALCGTCGLSIAASILNNTWSFTGLYLTGAAILMFGPKVKQRVHLGDDGNYRCGSVTNTVTLYYNKQLDSSIVQEVGPGQEAKIWQEPSSMFSKHNDLFETPAHQDVDVRLAFKDVNMQSADLVPENFPLIACEASESQRHQDLDHISITAPDTPNSLSRSTIGFISRKELFKYLRKRPANSSEFCMKLISNSNSTLCLGEHDEPKCLRLLENVGKYDKIYPWIGWMSIWQVVQMFFQRGPSLAQIPRYIPSYLHSEYLKMFRSVANLASTSIRSADSAVCGLSKRSPMLYAIELLETLWLWQITDEQQLQKFWFTLASSYVHENGCKECHVIHIARLSNSGAGQFGQDESEVLIWPSKSSEHKQRVQYVTPSTAENVGEGSIVRINATEKELDEKWSQNATVLALNLQNRDQEGSDDLQNTDEWYTDGLTLTREIQESRIKLRDRIYQSGVVLGESSLFSIFWSADSALNRAVYSRVVNEVLAVQLVVSGISAGGVLFSYVVGM